MMTAIVTHCPLTPPAYITFLVRTTCSADVTGSETGGSARQWCTLSLRGLPLLPPGALQAGFVTMLML